MFSPGQEYRRLELHLKFGGNRQGGIANCAKHPLIMIFSGDSGKKYGYDDEFAADGQIVYTGEGTKGPMRFVRGNKAIRDHKANGKELHVFKYTKRGYVKYIGQYVCTEIRHGTGRDIEENTRDIIQFVLTPHRLALLPYVVASPELLSVADDRLNEYRKRANQPYGSSPRIRKQLVNLRPRRKSVKEYALLRAGGYCEACDQLAPFLTKKTEPFLEVHHMYQLKDEGPDEPDCVIAICPNCHRRAHLGIDGDAYNDFMKARVTQKEKELDVTLSRS